MQYVDRFGSKQDDQPRTISYQADVRPTAFLYPKYVWEVGLLDYLSSYISYFSIFSPSSCCPSSPISFLFSTRHLFLLFFCLFRLFIIILSFRFAFSSYTYLLLLLLHLVSTPFLAFLQSDWMTWSSVRLQKVYYCFHPEHPIYGNSRHKESMIFSFDIEAKFQILKWKHLESPRPIKLNVATTPICFLNTTANASSSSIQSSSSHWQLYKFTIDHSSKASSLWPDKCISRLTMLLPLSTLGRTTFG